MSARIVPTLRTVDAFAGCIYAVLTGARGHRAVKGALRRAVRPQRSRQGAGHARCDAVGWICVNRRALVRRDASSEGIQLSVLLYIVLTVAIFGLLGVIQRAVERL